MSSKKSMADIWSYFEQVLAINNNVYGRGKWGQFVGGKQAFDCVNIIKAVNWCVPINQDITANQYDYIANHKDVMPDVDIAHFYNGASKKSTDMSKIPTDAYSFIYQNNGHIGIYNPTTGECFEMCGGSVKGVRKIKLIDCPTGYWNKWSNACYFVNTKLQPAPTPAPTPTPTPEPTKPYYYRVRKSWSDASSQVGAYTVYNNAVKKCDQVGNTVYTVYDESGVPKYGAELNAKQSTPTPSKPKYINYTVERGDCLWSIAAKYLGGGRKYKNIMYWNNLTSTNIYKGQVLKLYL